MISSSRLICFCEHHLRHHKSELKPVLLSKIYDRFIRIILKGRNLLGKYELGVLLEAILFVSAKLQTFKGITEHGMQYITIYCIAQLVSNDNDNDDDFIKTVTSWIFPGASFYHFNTLNAVKCTNCFPHTRCLLNFNKFPNIFCVICVNIIFLP